MIRVAAPPCDPLAVYDLRSKWPTEALHQQGAIELVDLPEGLKVRQVVRDGAKHLIGLSQVPPVDVVVLTRVLAGQLVDVIGWLQREGIACVLNLDDDFRHLPPLMGGHQKIDPRHSPAYNWRHMVRAASVADHVIVSTPALQSYAPHGRVSVIRNCVPASYLEVPRAGDGHTVGWSGTVASHAGDLDITRGGVGLAIREVPDARFLVVGGRAGVKARLALEYEPDETGTVEHEVYPFSLARLDVGIAPLMVNKYNESKSALKVLEMTALGIPWVASPSLEYVRFHAACEGVGALAKPRSRDWCREVRKALTRPEDERQAMSDAGREWVSDHATIEGNAWRMAEVLETAIAYRKGKVR